MSASTAAKFSDCMKLLIILCGSRSDRASCACHGLNGAPSDQNSEFRDRPPTFKKGQKGKRFIMGIPWCARKSSSKRVLNEIEEMPGIVLYTLLQENL
jgi:hypothetical protein